MMIAYFIYKALSEAKPTSQRLEDLFKRLEGQVKKTEENIRMILIQLDTAADQIKNSFPQDTAQVLKSFLTNLDNRIKEIK